MIAKINEEGICVKIQIFFTLIRGADRKKEPTFHKNNETLLNKPIDLYNAVFCNLHI